MTDEQPPHTGSEPTETPRSDIGRRIARRRAQLGLTRQETAERAGTTPGYLRHLEEHPTADPGLGVLIRLAGALHTSAAALRGGGIDVPPGLGKAARHPVLTELSAEQCRARLGSHGVGRLAVSTPEGPAIVPVNYTVIDGAIVFRTAPGSPPAAAVGTSVAFEVDHIDEALSRGWSVLVRGRAGAVTDAEDVRRLADRSYSRPWAGGPRDLWVRLEPDTVSGRETGERDYPADDIG
ncbi:MULTISPECIES: helix-turn-helix domain-containing protein [unclassified Streptomyces]|uniref:helix-turn-helix domain-containing protein n=1 Tax=Streptomyces sp. SYP-A7185 TaxID=3040076 RepID=UPI0038F640B6